MKLYAIVVSTCSAGYPEASEPILFTDRETAAATWHDMVSIDCHHNEQDDVLCCMKAFMDNAHDEEMMWVIGAEGPVDEMTTVSLFSTAVRS